MDPFMTTVAALLVIIAFFTGKASPESVREEVVQWPHAFLFLRDAAVLVAVALGTTGLPGFLLLAALFALLIASSQYSRAYPFVALVLLVLAPRVDVAGLLVLAAYLHGVLGSVPEHGPKASKAPHGYK